MKSNYPFVLLRNILLFFMLSCGSINLAWAEDSNTRASSENELTPPKKPKYDTSKLFIDPEPPDPNIDFYACKFHYVQTVNELIKQFYYNLGGNCLREIPLLQLADDLGINIVDKRTQKHNLISAIKSGMNEIVVTRYYDSFFISATDNYFKKNYSLFPKNNLPKKIPRPFVWIDSKKCTVQPIEYMKGDLLNLSCVANYLWNPVQRGRSIHFDDYGNHAIEYVHINLNRFNL